MEKWGFGLSRKEVLQIVADYVKENQININKFKDGMPGEDRFLSLIVDITYLLKNPRVLSTPEKNLYPFLIYDYFDLLEKL